jgi:hypothetical protein
MKMRRFPGLDRRAGSMVPYFDAVFSGFEGDEA